MLSVSEIVFVGQCEVFVLILFIFFPLGREAHKSILKKCLFFLPTPPQNELTLHGARETALRGMNDAIVTSSAKRTLRSDDIYFMPSLKISENNLIKFQIIRQCQNDVITVLLVARYRQQQVTAR